MFGSGSNALKDFLSHPSRRDRFLFLCRRGKLRPIRHSMLIVCSIVVCVMLTVMIPSGYMTDGPGKYVYGDPFSYITFYQLEPDSVWFLTNFFSGNDGMSFDPIMLVIDIFIVYLGLYFLLNIFRKRKAER